MKNLLISSLVVVAVALGVGFYLTQSGEANAYGVLSAEEMGKISAGYDVDWGHWFYYKLCKDDIVCTEGPKGKECFLQDCSRVNRTKGCSSDTETCSYCTGNTGGRRCGDDKMWITDENTEEPEDECSGTERSGECGLKRIGDCEVNTWMGREFYKCKEIIGQEDVPCAKVNQCVEIE